jgi:hypothetical protein
VKIADNTTHRVLAYVAAVERQGHRLTAQDVDAFAQRAYRNRPRAGLLAPDARPLVWLYRVGWIDLIGPSQNIVDEDEVVVTDLGRAALRALDEEAATPDSGSSTVTLDKDDPTALAKVIEQVNGLGECALVDRYFDANGFLPVIQRTQITRVLTGPGPAKRVAGVEQALADVKVDRNFEVRIDPGDDHHDRFIIPLEGPVLAIGTSLSGVGARHSIMTEISGAPADAIRVRFEEAWRGGRAIAPSERPTAPEAPKKVVERPPPAVPAAQVVPISGNTPPVAESFSAEVENS